MSGDHTGAAPAVLFLRLDSSWSFVDDIRRFVESFCAAACPDGDRAEQLALAAHELVQNAISYASAPGVDLRLALDQAAQRVRVSVSNAVRPDQAEVLRARLAAIVAHRDPLAGYLAAMRDSPEHRGGLGLPRVRFEAALELEMTHEGERVTVHAVGPLAPPPQDWMSSAGGRPAAALASA